MRWPTHLRMNYHDPVEQMFNFPLKFGTFGSPPSKYWLAHLIIKNFAFSAADVLEFKKKFMRFMQGLNGDITVAEFREMMKPELFEKVVESLGKLRGAGYRTRLINKYEGIIEWNVYGYMRYEGLSPFAFQNFAYNYYSIDQINTFGIPTRMEFTLDKKLLFEDKPGKDLIVFDNPFDIRTLPKESLHLHQMFEKFPVSILSADIGVLSRNKFLIIDLYEQQRVAEGEKSGDEYEFHILRFEKVCPKDLERFDRDLEYQRFMDVNFKYEQYNWVLSDVDQFMSYLPITS